MILTLYASDKKSKGLYHSPFFSSAYKSLRTMQLRKGMEAESPWGWVINHLLILQLVPFDPTNSYFYFF